MSFKTKNEKQNGMHFLDVQIIREDKTFTTSVYHCKHTFSEFIHILTAFYHIPTSFF